jgi:preprotein translocase subunit SecF
MEIINRKKIYFAISLAVLAVGLISLILYGIHPSIDFTGGSQFQFSYSGQSKVEESTVQTITQKYKANTINIHYTDPHTLTIRTTPVSQATKDKVEKDLVKVYPGLKETSFNTVGPTIGSETEADAIKAVLIASIAITLYVAFAFREVSKPVASWKFGVVAIAALLHDLIVVIGIFSLLGDFFGVEVDPLFITALLTIMGFSVHDTIVVFDRIRENLKKSSGIPFDRVVNNAVTETFNRSLNTSLTVIFVLVTLLLFGGASIRWFVVALLVGIISGTYSSIFTASPLLVVWYNWDQKRKGKVKTKK